MKILIVGAGVIGTVYGAQLRAAGHEISVLAHGSRTEDVARGGLLAHDVADCVGVRSPASVVERANGAFDLVLIALRRDDLELVGGALTGLVGRPLVLLFGNNPNGQRGGPGGIPGRVCLGFPGVGGTIQAGVARYQRIARQPTALEASPDPRLDELRRTLEGRGFPVSRVSEMSGWLAYHAVFVACVTAALYHCQTDPARLAADRVELARMCRAITDGFGALRSQGVGGLPRNLAILHTRVLQPVAVQYWRRCMRSPLGELAFAAHARHAEPEMRSLARAVLTSVTRAGEPDSLCRLLAQPAEPAGAANAASLDGGAAVRSAHSLDDGRVVRPAHAAKSPAPRPDERRR
jgi:2-dehydropantoate 2-reductase